MGTLIKIVGLNVAVVFKTPVTWRGSPAYKTQLAPTYHGKIKFAPIPSTKMNLATENVRSASPMPNKSTPDSWAMSG